MHKLLSRSKNKEKEKENAALSNERDTLRDEVQRLRDELNQANAQLQHVSNERQELVEERQELLAEYEELAAVEQELEAQLQIMLDDSASMHNPDTPAQAILQLTSELLSGRFPAMDLVMGVRNSVLRNQDIYQPTNLGTALQGLHMDRDVERALMHQLGQQDDEYDQARTGAADAQDNADPDDEYQQAVDAPASGVSGSHRRAVKRRPSFFMSTFTDLRSALTAIAGAARGIIPGKTTNIDDSTGLSAKGAGRGALPAQFSPVANLARSGRVNSITSGASNTLNSLIFKTTSHSMSSGLNCSSGTTMEGCLSTGLRGRRLTGSGNQGTARQRVGLQSTEANAADLQGGPGLPPFPSRPAWLTRPGQAYPGSLTDDMLHSRLQSRSSVKTHEDSNTRGSWCGRVGGNIPQPNTNTRRRRASYVTFMPLPTPADGDMGTVDACTSLMTAPDGLIDAVRSGSARLQRRPSQIMLQCAQLTSLMCVAQEAAQLERRASVTNTPRSQLEATASTSIFESTLPQAQTTRTDLSSLPTTEPPPSPFTQSVLSASAAPAPAPNPSSTKVMWAASAAPLPAHTASTNASQGTAVSQAYAELNQQGEGSPTAHLCPFPSPERPSSQAARARAKPKKLRSVGEDALDVLRREDEEYCQAVAACEPDQQTSPTVICDVGDGTVQRRAILRSLSRICLSPVQPGAAVKSGAPAAELPSDDDDVTATKAQVPGNRTPSAVTASGSLFNGVNDSITVALNSQRVEPVQYGPMLVDEAEALLGNASADYQFNAFELARVTGNRPLSCLGYFLMHREGLITKFRLHPIKLIRFLQAIESGYQGNPYHNAVHAADMLQTLHVTLHKSGMVPSYVDPLTLMSCYLAAAVHDYEHRGLTNDFLVNTSDLLAIRYNDRAPNENHHLAAAFTVLRTPDYNFLSWLPRADYEKLRKLIIDLVLATDMRQHFALCGSFRLVRRACIVTKKSTKAPLSGRDISRTPGLSSVSADWSAPRSGASPFSQQDSIAEEICVPVGPDSALVAPKPSELVNMGLSKLTVRSSLDLAPTSSQRIPAGLPGRNSIDIQDLLQADVSTTSTPVKPVEEGERMLSIQIAFKLSDLGHAAESLDVHLRWVAALEEEFFCQGDKEREAGLPISPLFDRTKPGVTRSQVGFFEVVVLPLFKSFVGSFPAVMPLLASANSNYKYWKDRQPSPMPAAS